MYVMSVSIPQPRYFLKIAIIALFLSCLGNKIQAHPHNWIALNTDFVLDDQLRLIQVKQEWEFDTYYSLMTHADLLNEYGDEQEGLPATAERMIRNLKEYDYFSKLSLDGSNIALGIPGQYSLFTREKEGKFFLVLEMTFDIKPVRNIENMTLAWQVYDPTYYIAMNHASESNIRIVGGDATECAKKLEFPEPSDELVDYAQSLDRTQKDTEGLGASFAETAFITCI